MAKFRLHLTVMDSADSHTDTKTDGPGAGRRQPAWRASALALFLPGLVVAGGYAALWLFLHLDGRGDGPLARVCLLVLVIGVPLILAHAGLRLSTTGLALRGAHLEAHPGFPARDPVSVAYTAVTGVSLKRGLSGWITGAGSLVIERENAPTVVVAGLADPEGARADLSGRLAELGVSMSRA